jgi:SPX domain protein involved in polyphosphate accumulation
LLKIIFFLTFILFFVESYAYELPQVKVQNEKEPTITLFKAESIVVNDVKKYKLIWKTQNATHVQLTFFGNVQPSGNLIITEKEYQQGPITLTATSTKNSAADSKTINKFIKADKEAPVIIVKEKKLTHEFYTTPIVPINPHRRHVPPPRRVRPY